MKIGISLLAFEPNISGGIEFYVHNLLRSLAEIDHDNTYYIFTNLDNHDAFRFHQPNFHWIQQKIHARPQIWRVFWEQLTLPITAIRFQLDVLHSPSYTWPILSPVPGVVTICDMLYKHYPKTIGEPKLSFWRLFVPWSAKRCRKVITISNNSKLDIVRGLGVPLEKVIVTPLAVDSRLYNNPTLIEDCEIERICEVYKIRQPYILNVGGLGRHKNSAALVKALSILHQHKDIFPLYLVITGNDYGIKNELETIVEQLGLTGYVFFPGYIAHEDLPSLYKGAEVYASVSNFEGFGLTPLEAMGFGLPVIASNRSALPEVVGDAGRIVNPSDIEEIAISIHEIITDPQKRKMLQQLGYRRANDFSWKNTAELTLKAYSAACSTN